MKIGYLANSVDPDEVAHNHPSNLDLDCLPSSLIILNMIYCTNIFLNFADVNLTVCFLGALRVKITFFNVVEKRE